MRKTNNGNKTKPTKKRKIVGGLTFRHTMFFALFVGVLAQVTHFYDAVITVFSINNEHKELEGVLFCLAFGGAIMIWTACASKWLVAFFSIVEMIINSYYTINHAEGTGAIIMGLLLGVVLPLSNYFYCEELMFGNSHAKNKKKARPATKPEQKPEQVPIPQAA